MPCTDVCSEHSGLTTSITWVKGLLATGFSLVLAAVVYFNNVEHKNDQRLYQEISKIGIQVAGIHTVIQKKSSEHNLEIAHNTRDITSLENKFDAIEKFCCSGAVVDE